MHAAKLSKSRRLQVLLRILKSRRPRGMTGLELASRTGSLAIATDVSELRHSGVLIRCDYDFTTAEGRRVFRYRLV